MTEGFPHSYYTSEFEDVVTEDFKSMSSSRDLPHRTFCPWTKVCQLHWALGCGSWTLINLAVNADNQVAIGNQGDIRGGCTLCRDLSDKLEFMGSSRRFEDVGSESDGSRLYLIASGVHVPDLLVKTLVQFCKPEVPAWWCPVEG